MSVSTNFYRSVLVQIPVRPSAEFKFYGCGKHPDIKFLSDAKFCSQCGERLKNHQGNKDLKFINALIDANDDLEEVASCHIDEGFINITLYDYNKDEVNFENSFYSDEYGHRASIPVSVGDFQRTYDRILSNFVDFFKSLNAEFPEIVVTTALTKTVG